MRRLEAATPLSMAEIQADKDQLRAEFAMSTRRLEMNVEQLKTKTTSQLAELGKKNDAINRLKVELGEKSATIFALEAREKALKDQMKATEDELSVKTIALHETERTLSDKQADLAKLAHRPRRPHRHHREPAGRSDRAEDPDRRAEDAHRRLRARHQEDRGPARQASAAKLAAATANSPTSAARSKISASRIGQLEHQLRGANHGGRDCSASARAGTRDPCRRSGPPARRTRL